VELYTFMPAVMPLKEWALAPEVHSSQGTAIQKLPLAAAGVLPKKVNRTTDDMDLQTQNGPD
jgi:hypothetical protein